MAEAMDVLRDCEGKEVGEMGLLPEGRLPTLALVFGATEERWVLPDLDVLLVLLWLEVTLRALPAG